MTRRSEDTQARNCKLSLANLAKIWTEARRNERFNRLRINENRFDSWGPDLAQRLKRFKQKCELLFDGSLKPRSDEQKCKYLLLWTGKYGLDLYNTWNLSEEQQNSLEEYWKRLKEHVKPQSEVKAIFKSLLPPKLETKQPSPRRISY